MASSSIQIVSAQTSTADYWPTEEWRFATPESKGMNSTKLDELSSRVYDENMRVHSMIIVKDGYIVAEEYFSNTFSSNTTHALYSATKSVTSILVGVAMQQGFLDNVSQKVLDFFPERTFDNVDERKRAMTLEHLLTMMPGIEWDEWSVPYGDGNNDYIQMMTSSDPVGSVLNRPMASDPGTVWTYCGGASHLLSTIVNITTEMNTLQFAQENLFGPIGIQRAYWGDDSQGVNIGGSELSLRPRDMARLGYLYLMNGTWDGQQIVSEEWVSESTDTKLMISDMRGYSYQWWTYPEIGAYYATGLYGQQIIVIPEHGLVVTFTGGFVGEASPYTEFLRDYIIPAAEDDITEELEYDPTLLILTGGLLLPIIIVAVILKQKRSSSH